MNGRGKSEEENEEEEGEEEEEEEMAAHGRMTAKESRGKEQNPTGKGMTIN